MKGVLFSIKQSQSVVEGKFIFLAIQVVLLFQVIYYFHWAWVIGLLFWSFRLWRLNLYIFLIGLLLTGMVLLGSNIVWKTPDLINSKGTYLLKLDSYYLVERDSGVRGTVKVSSPSGWQEVEIYAWDIKKSEIPSGVSYMKIEGEMYIPEVARNFGVFDYAHYLKTKGINQRLKIKKIMGIKKARGLNAWFSSMRAGITEHFLKFDSLFLMSLYNRLVWNVDSLAYRQAKEYLGQLGIVHFFALSGLHMTVLAKFLTKFLKRIGIVNEFVSPMVLILLGLYTYLTGFPIGVVRSFLMMLFKYVTPLNRMDRLSLTAMIYLCVFPFAVGNLGFILSFFISFTLIWIEKIEVNKWLTPILGSLVCLSFTWAFTLGGTYVWYPLQVVWVLGLGSIFSCLFFPYIVLMTGLSFFPSVLNYLSQWTGQGIEGIQVLLSFLNPGFVLGAIPWWVSLLLFFSSGLFLHHWKKGLITTLVVYGVLFVLNGRIHGDRIIILDVGQGDALLYQSAVSKKSFLVDTGGKPLWGNRSDGLEYDKEYGLRNLVPSLHALGISKIDTLLITHPDLDHMGNLPILLEKVKVKQILVNRESIENPHFIKMIQPYSIPIKEVGLGKNQFGENIEVYNLGVLDDANLNDRSNESSLLVKMKLGSYFFLNMGDMTKAGERQLVEDYPEIRAEFLKVGHHGSSTSTDPYFLQQIEAKVGIISAGVGNRYGHPHEEVLNNLREANMILRQTNRDGAIMIDFNPVLDRITMDTAIK